MRVKNAKKASSELQKMQTTLGRNCCSKTAPKLSAVIHCLQWITAKIALKMQWDFGHSGNLQNLQGNYLQCIKSMNFGSLYLYNFPLHDIDNFYLLRSFKTYLMT